MNFYKKNNPIRKSLFSSCKTLLRKFKVFNLKSLHFNYFNINNILRSINKVNKSIFTFSFQRFFYYLFVSIYYILLVYKTMMKSKIQSVFSD